MTKVQQFYKPKTDRVATIVTDGHRVRIYTATACKNLQNLEAAAAYMRRLGYIFINQINY